MHAQETHTHDSSRPGIGRALAAGFLAGCITGLVATAVSVPLRRFAGVTDRSLINGLSLTGGAILLWTCGGLLYGGVARVSRRPWLWLLLAMALVAALGFGAIYAPLADYTTRLPSCAVPLLLLVTLGGVAVFLVVLAAPWRLLFGPPLGFAAAAAVAVIVVSADRAPKVHYTLSRLSSAATAQSAAPAESTPAASPTPAAPLHFTVSNQSEASFTVREKLVRLPAPSDAIGKTSALTGDIYLLPTGLAPSPPSAFSLDLNTLTSDAPPRDRYIKANTLETAKYPTATFTVTEVQGFPAAYKEGDQVNISVTGTFNVHGVDKPLTWTGQAQYAAGQLEAVLSTDFNMSDFDMTPPNNAVVQSVEQHVHLDLHLVAQRQPS